VGVGRLARIGAVGALLSALACSACSAEDGGRDGSDGGGGTGGSAASSGGGAGGTGAVATGGASGGAAGAGASAGSGGAGGATSCSTTPGPVPGASGKSIFVAFDGSDTAGDGSLSQPYRAIEKGCAAALPGDAIALRGGTWNTALESCSAKGTADQPVHVRPHSGESVVLDATGYTLASNQHVLQVTHANWVVVDGIEVRGSSGRGVGYYESTGVMLRNLKVHDVAFRALGGGGDEIVIENNEVWNASLTNANNSSGGSGWPGAIQTYARADGSPSKNVVIRNNYVHDAWGECVIALFADGVTIEGNRLRDCYSVSLYVDNSKNVRVERNQIWTTTDKYNKNGARASGITFASESYGGSVPKQAIENLVIANNLITQTGMGISRWQDPANTLAHNTWNGVQILHNGIRGATKVSLYIESVGSLPAPAGGIVMNNVIWKGAGGDAVLEDANAWQVGPNAWPDGKPGADASAASITGDPGMLGPLSADDPNGFRLGPSSPCEEQGAPAPPVTTDFWCAPRSPSSPSLGIHEPSVGSR
jgi:hypothetical protein